MKEKRLGKRQQLVANKAFSDAVAKELEAAGAKPLEGWEDDRIVIETFVPRRFMLDTKAGPMRCGALPSSFGHGGQLYAQFLDVKLACQFFRIQPGTFFDDLNGCSGKWNLFLFDLPVEEVGAEVRRRLAKVLG